MADFQTADSLGFNEASVRFSSEETEVYPGVEKIVIAENEYVIHQGEGAVVVPRGSVSKIAMGEDVTLDG